MHQSGAETRVTEEPYAFMAHVRICGGAGWATTGSTRQAFASQRYARQLAKERLGRVIRDFRDQICRSLVPIELFAPCDHPQRLVAGIAANATRPAIEIGSLDLHWSHQRFYGAADELAGSQHPVALRTVDLRTIMFTAVDLRHHRFGDTPGELLAQVPHRGGHLQKGGRWLVPLLLEDIQPLVKACMELLAQGVPIVSLHGCPRTR